MPGLCGDDQPEGFRRRTPSFEGVFERVHIRKFRQALPGDANECRSRLDCENSEASPREAFRRLPRATAYLENCIACPQIGVQDHIADERLGIFGPSGSVFVLC